MPRKGTRQETVSTESFLRSINLRYDAEAPERIAHLHPTSKSVGMLTAILGSGERAHLIVAPYGSGKSLLATYLLHVVENRESSMDALTKIEKRLHRVTPSLAKELKKRRKDLTQRGIVIALHGYSDSLSESLKEAAVESLRRISLKRQARTIEKMSSQTSQDAIEIMARLQTLGSKQSLDRIIIIWDEFGRHAESLVAHGQTAAMGDLQLLAEYATRSRKVPISIALLLHQGILHYAGSAPQSVRSEWAKIEGRFKSIQYVDDSKELYGLIADVVAARATIRLAKSTAKTPASCKKHDAFADFDDSELNELLERAYPLDPIVLYLLPRISARVAQNERTLFSFISSVDLSQSVSVSDLYDYFSPSMRADTAVGGTYRQWLETQSAISKVAEDEHAVKALKAACLLGFGTAGERSRARRGLLVLTIQGYGPAKPWVATVQRLVDRKLLLYRKHSDEVSVWHGTDIDLRGRLEEEKRRQSEQFDPIDFLSKEAPPPTWKPTEYNDNFRIRRYLASSYESKESLTEHLNQQPLGPQRPVRRDGQILYLVAESAAERRWADKNVHDFRNEERLVIAVPREGIPLSAAALEVWCLMRLQDDPELAASDPMVNAELQQMADDAREHLQRMVDRLVRPSAAGPRWFHAGSEMNVRSPQELRRKLSTVMERAYPNTPRINNEVIVRRKPTAVVVNARKKLLLGILERAGRENLGIQGNYPDSSMFRSIFLHTGLYRQDQESKEWAFATVDDASISDENLRAVWRRIHDFLTVPCPEPKKPAELFDKLTSPPCGLREGLLPILFAAGLKAFPSPVSLTQKGSYIIDILPSVIEQLCREPDSYRLVVLDLNEQTLKYLKELYRSFSETQKRAGGSENDVIRQCFDAIESWKSRLPAAAQATRRLSERTRNFLRALERYPEPVQLLLKRIPSVCDHPIGSPNLMKAVVQCLSELASVKDMYVSQAGDTLRQAIALDVVTDEVGLSSLGRHWVGCFPEDVSKKLSDGVASGLLSRLGMPYDSDDKLLESLSSLLVGRAISQWDDATLARFHRELNQAIRQVEAAALSAARQGSSNDVTTRKLSTLLQGRLLQQFATLVELIGVEDAERVSESLGNDYKERKRRANNSRSDRKSVG